MTDAVTITRQLQDALDRGDAAAALIASDGFFAAAQDITGEAWFLRGQVAEKAGDYLRAYRSYRRAGADEKLDSQRLNYLGHFFLNTGCPGPALSIFERLDAQVPDHPDVLAARARALLDTGAYEQSIAAWHKLATMPAAGDVRLQLALAMALSGDVPQALETIEGDGKLLAELIVELHGWEMFRPALDAAKRAAALFPNDAQAWNYRGIVSAALGDAADAVACYEKALALGGPDPDILANLGAIQASSGNTAAALATLDRALLARPDDVRVLRQYVDCTRLGADDDVYQALVRLSGSDALSDPDRAAVAYALGKACDDMGRHSDAIRLFIAGGAARARSRAITAADEIALLDRIKDMFPRIDAEAVQGRGSKSGKPIFVLGLPRSGTTLVEQILAGIDDVTGAGELPYLRNAVLRHADGRQGNRTLPSWEFLEPDRIPGAETFERIGRDYIAMIDALMPGSACVVDKQPMNDRYLGFAALAFPNATIIHCVRDLRDTCVSCISKNFEAEIAFTDTLEGMTDYALAQRALMAFWEEMFPGRIVTVRYEDLVAHPETEARKLVQAAGLRWSDTCLDLAASERVVNTASAQQVKKDIYRSAVHRWERYMPEIEPLIRRLGGRD
ncbi:MAG: sulfotransferase [Rhodospirillales bacterium]|nr:sulfotransferase [Rhodospirillales bacterium]